MKKNGRFITEIGVVELRVGNFQNTGGLSVYHVYQFLGGGLFQRFLECSPRKIGEDQPNLRSHIFQMGGETHQPDV